MNWNENRQVRIALLDLYEGKENQGMRCIREIVHQWGQANQLEYVLDEFDVRQNLAVPGLNYDIYISSGGPGSPLESIGSDWENKYYEWLQNVEAWNNDVSKENKKYVFFICHSFQMACRYYNAGNVCKRKSTAFGIFPIHMMQGAKGEPVFEGLKDPFYAVDSRDFQVIEPNHAQLKKLGAKILAIEKERPHVPYERAVMAIRFSDYFIGTQFHPEADPTGMSMYLNREDKMQTVIENYGREKWQNMIDNLNDPRKITLTYQNILPNFLNQAVAVLA
ncbi:type 1 glutamine amidotransferase [Aridibaculum aurantiacum]|uniref:type 1 glutamine amidotransferase n=1 Tax=Aridibaculum aurantiacum TaxID=2810307 RepID=UPI001A97831F|nr:homoserine O-succinyltransferase [Aridibaculum aurantiacum]